MFRLISIFAILPGLAFAVDVTTSDDWQSIVQTSGPTTTINFAAGTYSTTNTALLITNAGVRIVGAGPSSSYLIAGSYSNSGVVRASATNILIGGFTVTGGNTTNFGGGVYGVPGTVVSNCSIVSNYSKAGGGGTYGACVSDSLVAFNSSGDRCGGSQFVSSSFARNSVYSNNVAATHAGAAGMSYDDRGFGVLFTNCAIVANTQATWGAVSFGATLVDCALSGNRSVGASDVRPGAWGSSDTGTASRCVFSFNSSPGDGGAAYAGRALDCLFVSNSAAGNGGAVYGGWASNCAFVGNVATQRGGAASGGSFTNCVFSNNVTVGISGGALYLPAKSAFCRFYGNRANNYGGAVHYGTHKSGLFVSNWVVASGAGEGGGGASGYDLFLRSCLFDGNWAPSGRVQQVSAAHEAFNCTFVGGTNHGPAASIRTNSYLGRNCLSWGNVDNAIVYSTNLANCATNVDPQFIPGTFVPTAAGVVDAGDDAYATTPLDFRGKPRITGSSVDLGAAEYDQSTDALPSATTERKRRFLFFLGGSR